MGGVENNWGDLIAVIYFLPSLLQFFFETLEKNMKNVKNMKKIWKNMSDFKTSLLENITYFLVNYSATFVENLHQDAEKKKIAPLI